MVGDEVRWKGARWRRTSCNPTRAESSSSCQIGQSKVKVSGTGFWRDELLQTRLRAFPVCRFVHCPLHRQRSCSRRGCEARRLNQHLREGCEHYSRCTFDVPQRSRTTPLLFKVMHTLTCTEWHSSARSPPCSLSSRTLAC